VKFFASGVNPGDDAILNELKWNGFCLSHW
jgi:hypothetical protein